MEVTGTREAATNITTEVDRYPVSCGSDLVHNKFYDVKLLVDIGALQTDKANHTLQQLLTQKNIEIRALTEMIEKLERQLDDRLACEELKLRLQEKESESTALSKKGEKLERDLSSAKYSIQKLTEKVTENFVEMGNLKKQLAEKDGLLGELMKKVNQLEGEIDAAKENKREVVTQVKVISSEMQVLRGKLEITPKHLESGELSLETEVSEEEDH